MRFWYDDFGTLFLKLGIGFGNWDVKNKKCRTSSEARHLKLLKLRGNASNELSFHLCHSPEGMRTCCSCFDNNSTYIRSDRRN